MNINQSKKGEVRAARVVAEIEEKTELTPTKDTWRVVYSAIDRIWELASGRS